MMSRGRSESTNGAPWGWSAAHTGQRVAIVGATGAVGRELAQLLVQAGHPRAKLGLFARASGTLRVPGTVEPREPAVPVELDVRPLSTADWAAFDVAFLCTPADVSQALAPVLVERGLAVVDLSSAFRMHPDVPLVVPEINGDLLDLVPARSAGRLIANPNCTTAIACMPLAVIDRELGLEEVIVVSFQAASGAGVPGLSTLAFEAREAVGAEPTSARPESPFAAPLVHNVIPAVSDVDATGTSGEERKVIDETRRILRRPDLVVEVTTTRVPVERCHSVAVHVRTRRDVDLPALIGHLAAAPGIVVTTDPHGPRPREHAGQDPVAVGRIRAGTRGSRSLCFFAVGDQIRKGAALNALQVAARLPPAVRTGARPSA
jgi:aspartate-semialdehyde dehydrogenase